MHAEHVDPRTRRTVTALRNALLELAASTPVAEIDISTLCRTAGVHRTTFYKHFATVSDLGRCLVTGLLARIDDPAITVAGGFTGWLTAVLEQAAGNRHVYRYILTDRGDPAVQRLLCERLTAATHAALVAAAARGDNLGLDPEALAGALGYGCYGLVEAALADDTLDIRETVHGMVGLLPEPLRPVLVA